MWISCLIASFGVLILFAVISIGINNSRVFHKTRFNLFNALFAGVFAASVLLFFPIHYSEVADGNIVKTFLLSLFNSMQIYTIGCEYAIVQEGIAGCPEGLAIVYQIWAALLFVSAPVFTFGFVLSLFKNLTSYLKYLLAFFKDVYVFSELNEKSIVLAADLKSKYPKAAIVFTDVFDENEESTYELIEKAREMGAITFKNDILVINFRKHSSKKSLYFFTIGVNQTENMNQTLKLIEIYKKKENIHIYMFSTKLESELLLAEVDRGNIKVRRINEVKSLINRVLYEHGEILFESAKPAPDGRKHISAAVIGMGMHGVEMMKALTWYGQMDGYTIEIHAFDKDPLAEEKFMALAPELMSEDYNGVEVAGEALYTIRIHPDMQVETDSFAREIEKLRNATYVLVALGDDELNINTAVTLRMYFERMKIHPVIQAIVYNSEQRKALTGIKNYRGQAYDIDFIGDLESSYTSDVIIDSELEEEALARHLKWGSEDEFWNYEYNYRSSMASAIHRIARIRCGIPGAEKAEEELTIEERDIIEALEHRRWNAYMRAEGYVFSGSKEKSSRNDLAKMHHDLVDFASLSEEERRKDSQIGIVGDTKRK